MTGKGAYLGTEIGGKWYRRYREKPWFMRGNGEYRIEGGVLYFRRYLTETALELPLARIVKITLSSWHAGKWAMGRRVIQLHWRQGELDLVSGFVLTRSEGEEREVARRLEGMR